MTSPPGATSVLGCKPTSVCDNVSITGSYSNINGVYVRQAGTFEGWPYFYCVAQASARVCVYLPPCGGRTAAMAQYTPTPTLHAHPVRGRCLPPPAFRTTTSPSRTTITTATIPTCPAGGRSSPRRCPAAPCSLWRTRATCRSTGAAGATVSAAVRGASRRSRVPQGRADQHPIHSLPPPTSNRSPSPQTRRGCLQLAALTSRPPPQCPPSSAPARWAPPMATVRAPRQRPFPCHALRATSRAGAAARARSARSGRWLPPTGRRACAPVPIRVAAAGRAPPPPPSSSPAPAQ